MLILRTVRPAFAYHWLVAALGVLLAWPLVALTRLGMPLSRPLMAWQVTERFDVAVLLLVDDKSWPMGLAATSVVVAVILTIVARQQPPNWRAWAGTLVLGGVGLLAIWAGNLVTLLLAWTALDLLEMLILFANLKEAETRQRVVVAFAARMGGLWLLMASVVFSFSVASDFSEPIPPQASLYLLLAAGLRLGVLPLNVPFLNELPMRRGLGTTLRLIPAAASLTLLVRVADTSLSGGIGLALLILTALAALLGGVLWAASPDELSGRPFWVLGMASLAVAAALNSSAQASLTWSLALILSGGLVLLYSLRSRFSVVLPLLGLLGAAALPFTPTWDGLRLYEASTPPGIGPVCMAAHAFLLAGYLRHALRPAALPERVERGVWLIYLLGLIILPATMVLGQWGGWMTHPPSFEFSPAWWGGAVALGGALAMLILGRRFGGRLPTRFAAPLTAALSFQWLYRLLWGVYQLVGQGLAYVSLILEGEGGLLWAMVFLVLIISLAPWGGRP